MKLNTFTLETEVALLTQSLLMPKNAPELRQKAIRAKIRQKQIQIADFERYTDLHDRVGYGK